MTDGTRKPPARRVAVYWDFENLAISEYDRCHGKKAWRDDTGSEVKPGRAAAAAVHLDALLAFAASLGTVVVNRAYCDWTRPILDVYGSQLAQRCVTPVQMFSAITGKNGADIRIALDVVEDFRWDGDLTDVVLFSGDGDFAPVADFCRLHGITIHAVGVRNHTSRFWQSSCRFRFLDAVARGRLAPPAMDVDPLTLLAQAIRQLPAGQELDPAHLVPLMRRLHWAFELPTSDLAEVSNLVTAAISAGLLERGNSPGTLRLTAAPPSPVQPDEARPVASPSVPTPPTPPTRWPTHPARRAGISVLALTSALTLGAKLGARGERRRG